MPRDDDDDRFSNRPRSRSRRKEDDDDDDDRRSAAAESDSRSALTIVGIIAAVILGIVVVCGGVSALTVFMIVNAADRARQDVQKQFDRIIDEDMKRQRDLMDRKKGQQPAPPPGVN